MNRLAASIFAAASIIVPAEIVVAQTSTNPQCSRIVLQRGARAAERLSGGRWSTAADQLLDLELEREYQKWCVDLAPLPAPPAPPRTIKSDIDDARRSAGSVAELLDAAELYRRAGYLREAKTSIDEAKTRAKTADDWRAISAAYDALIRDAKQ